METAGFRSIRRSPGQAGGSARSCFPKRCKGHQKPSAQNAPAALSQYPTRKSARISHPLLLPLWVFNWINWESFPTIQQLLLPLTPPQKLRNAKLSHLRHHSLGHSHPQPCPGSLGSHGHASRHSHIPAGKTALSQNPIPGLLCDKAAHRAPMP